MRAWKRFWKLARRDRVALLEVTVVIVASRVGLRIAGYRRWKSLLSRFSFPNINSSHAPETQFVRFESPRHLGRVADSVARNLFFRPSCLERSLGLWWVLRRRGFEARLRIGGRKIGARFEAHAWVECAGVSLGDAGDEQDQFSIFGDSSAVAARGLR